jgi:glutamate synthase domain-containing protein 1
MMYDDAAGQEAGERVIAERCDVHHVETIPTKPLDRIRNRPVLLRYFVRVKPADLKVHYDQTEDDRMVDLVMKINGRVDGAFVVSSGKNMGIFKGVGYPEDIGEFFRLDEYAAYLWTSHGRFPTNTTGWWGGAHPFGLLDWSVVHNGEISSYGINRRYLMNFGYRCALHTDTEVITYLFDLLMRRHELPLDAACIAMAPPFWTQIERMDLDRQEVIRTLRIVYGGALINGPFSVLVGRRDGMIGFNDRIKLRPMVAARKDDRLYIASEEAAIRVICSKPDTLWHAEGGVPIVGKLKTPAAASVA